MLTPDQITQLKAGLPQGTVKTPVMSSSAPATTDWVDSLTKQATPKTPEINSGGILTQSLKQGVSGLGELYGGGEQGIANKLKEDITSGASDIQKGMETGGLAGTPDVLKGFAKSGLRTAGDVAGTIYAPIGAAISATGVGSALSKAGQAISDFSHISDIPAVQEFAVKHPNAAEDFGRLMNIIFAGQEKGKIEPSTVIERTVPQIESGIKSVGSIANKGVELGSKIKEGVKPSLTPEEATGQIIQGKTEDVATAHRVLKDLNTEGVKTYKDLQNKINEEIKTTAPKVDAELNKDTSGGKSIKSFEQTIGEGKSGVKVNYVKQAITDLKDYYTKTGNAEGLSKMKALENNAKIKGMTYKEVNDLAKLHGREINAFNANGEAASGLTKQAAENTRTGLKGIARKALTGKEAQALDAKLSDLYDTKTLIDKWVERVNASSQRTPKQGVIPKAVGATIKTADMLTGNPLKAIGKGMGMGVNSSSMNPLEIEANLAKNLRTVKGESFLGDLKSKISNIPNKQGGFIGKANTIADKVSKEIANYDATPATVNGKPLMTNTDAEFRLSQLQNKIKTKALTPAEIKEAIPLLEKVGIKIK